MKIANVVIIMVIAFILVESSTPHNIINPHKINTLKNRGSVYNGGILWTDPVQITWAENSKKPAVYENSGNYDLVWQDFRNGNWDIYYAKVTPSGFKLVNDSRITTYPGKDANPKIISKGNMIFVFWNRYIDNHWSIYYARLHYSNKNISIEIPPMVITETTNNCTNPDVTMDKDGFLHVVWQQWTGTNWDVFYDKLDISGKKVFSPINISRDKTNSTKPKIISTPDNKIEITWIDDNPSPGYSIMYRGLDCCGYFRTPLRRISVVSPNTTMSMSYDYSLHLVFSCSRENKTYEIMYTQLNDSGITIIDDTNLTSLDGKSSTEPYIQVYHGAMLLVWNDNGTIKFNAYSASGSSKKMVENISDVKYVSDTPSIAAGNGQLGVFWSQHVGSKNYIFGRFGRFINLRAESLQILQENHGNILNITAKVSSDTNTNISVQYILKDNETIVLRGEISFEKTSEISLQISAPKGAQNITFVLDPENRIIENNESDNILSQNFFVKYYKFSAYIPEECQLTPGNKTNVTIKILNEGNWKDEYTITIKNMSKQVYVIQNTKEIYVNPGNSVAINITVIASINAKIGLWNLTVVINSISNQTLSKTLKVFVQPYSSFDVVADNVIGVYPGKKHKIPLTIINNGNFNDTFKVTVHSTNPWPIYVENETVNVSLSSEKKIYVSITVPNGTKAFQKNIMEITVTSSNTRKSKNLTLIAIVQAYHRAIATIIKSNYTNLSFYALINIFNLGNIPELYTFMVSGSLAEKTVLNEYSAFIPVNQNRTIKLWTMIPENLTSGSYEIYFVISSGNITLYSLKLTITVPPVWGFIINKSVENGKIILKITNTGNTMDTYTISVNSENNITWILIHNNMKHMNYTSVVIPSNKTAEIIIEPKKKLMPGEYHIKITILTSSKMTKNLTLTLLIGRSQVGGFWDAIAHNLTYIVIIIVAVVAIIIYLYIRE